MTVQYPASHDAGYSHAYDAEGYSLLHDATKDERCQCKGTPDLEVPCDADRTTSVRFIVGNSGSLVVHFCEEHYGEGFAAMMASAHAWLMFGDFLQGDDGIQAEQEVSVQTTDTLLEALMMAREMPKDGNN